ncbi:MAG: DNA primase [Bacilli bacterium]
MKTLTSEEINNIRSSVDIVSVVMRYIPLTKKGKNYFGVCPFHEDSDPSLSVSPEKQIFSCFSCHTAGNVFNFIMEYEHVSFIEAVRIVANIAGIEVAIADYKKDNVYQKEIHDIYDISLKFYTNNINTSLGIEAKNYLIKRGLTDELIKKFEIGLAIKSTDTLSKLLEKKQFKDNDLINSGLVIKDEKGFHDFFYHRIMFPLHDINNKVVGYSARAYYDTDGPKYINSKEHLLFKKGEFLYNYANSKEACRSQNTVILMEGFMDVIRAYSIGISNVVATLGTAFTHQHANLIKRLANNVIICYDGDDPGAKASIACSNELIKVGIIPKIVRLEDNLDPDDYILKNGQAKFNEKISNPLNVMDFKLSFFKKNIDLTQATDKAKYATMMLEELNKIDDDILKEITLKKLSNEIDLDVEFLKSKLIKKQPTVNKKVMTVVTSKYDMAQEALLFYMLKSGEVIKIFDNQALYFPNKEYRLLAHEISYFYKTYNYINVADFLTDLDLDMSKIVGYVISLNLQEEYTLQLIEDYIKAINEKNIEDECERLSKKLQEETDIEQKEIIGQRIIELLVRGEKDV